MQMTERNRGGDAGQNGNEPPETPKKKVTERVADGWNRLNWGTRTNLTIAGAGTPIAGLELFRNPGTSSMGFMIGALTAVGSAIALETALRKKANRRQQELQAQLDETLGADEEPTALYVRGQRIEQRADRETGITTLTVDGSNVTVATSRVGSIHVKGRRGRNIYSITIYPSRADTQSSQDQTHGKLIV